MRPTTLKHSARAHKDQPVTPREMLWRNWQAIGGLEDLPWTGTMRIKACAAEVSDDWMCSHVCLCMHEYAFIHYHECPLVEKKNAPVSANKHFCIVDSTAMILLVNLSAFDSKPLEAIISDKWKLYMKINIQSFVREKITLLGNKQGTGLRAMLPVIHISTAFKLLKRLEIIIGHIFFPFFSTQMARLGYLTFTSGL